MLTRLFRLVAVLGGLAAGSILAATQTRTTAEQAEVDATPARIAGVRVSLVVKIVASLSVLGVIGGFLLSASGVIPIKASSGHWAMTAWFLDFSKNRSVSTYALGITAPNLDDPAIVLKGAGHYETGCAPCHGSPALPLPRIAGRMTPPPPELGANLAQWKPAELFYIVKHGIKFTGMPAWPAPQRDDEVWAMTAFLRQLPRLDANTYRQLAQGTGSPNADGVSLAGLVLPETARRVLAESCARCHGYDGLGRGLSAFPKVAGLPLDYQYASLQAYARQQRHSGQMEPIAASLSEETMRALAGYYAQRLRLNIAFVEPDAAIRERGRRIAEQGIPAQRVAACVACHGPNPTERHSHYPPLAGQYADYLVLQLQLFQEGKRGGTAYAHVMRQAVAYLNAEQQRDVALYYAALQ